MATTGLIPNTRMSSGVMSEPPPIPVVPTRTPTPRPKRIRSGSMSSARVDAALDLVRARPASGAVAARVGAVRASDRGVAAIVQRVVGDVVGGDVGPDVALGPVGQRVELPQAVLAVPVQLGRVGAPGRLIAAQPGDPGVDVGEGLVERRDLADRAAAVGVAVPQRLAVPLGLLVERDARVAVDGDAVVLLHAVPRRV